MQEINDALNKMPINQEYIDPKPTVVGQPKLDTSTPNPDGSLPTIQSIPQGVQLGPKYLSALDKVDSLVGMRSFETELPILKVKATVSPMTGAEEQNLRTSSVSPDGFLNNVNKLIFEHTVFEGLIFSSFEDFLENFYPQDKTLLIWALLTSSYSKLPTMQKTCAKCKEIYEVSLRPQDILKQDGLPSIWSEKDNPDEYRSIHSILDGSIIFEIGLPSEKDRTLLASLYNADQIKKNIDTTGNILSYVDNLTFFIKRVIVKDPAGDIILSNVVHDIYPFMRNLSPKVKDFVEEAINLKEFDKYMTEFYEMVNCKHCGNQERIEFVPEVEFFRKALSAF